MDIENSFGQLGDVYVIVYTTCSRYITGYTIKFVSVYFMVIRH